MYSENLELSFRVRDQLLSVKTDYQRIDVFDTYDFGKLLAIDGTVQLTERDEFVYHDFFAQVAVHAGGLFNAWPPMLRTQLGYRSGPKSPGSQKRAQR